MWSFYIFSSLEDAPNTHTGQIDNVQLLQFLLDLTHKTWFIDTV